jgi:hypothetical protein
MNAEGRGVSNCPSRLTREVPSSLLDRNTSGCMPSPCQYRLLLAAPRGRGALQPKKQRLRNPEWNA